VRFRGLGFRLQARPRVNRFFAFAKKQVSVISAVARSRDYTDGESPLDPTQCLKPEA
jgi:hypothetical protein